MAMEASKCRSNALKGTMAMKLFTDTLFHRHSNKGSEERCEKWREKRKKGEREDIEREIELKCLRESEE